jgi:hypothetical protein
MQRNLIRAAVCGALAASLAACGGGSSDSAATDSVTSFGNVPMVISDASSDDWALIGVRVLSIALLPQGGGSPVPAWTAPAGMTYVNLEQLDQIGELLGNMSIPVGTYTGAVVTVSANPGDVMLTVASEPEAGFSGTPSASIAAGNIQIVNPQGSAPNLTHAINVSFDSPLVVTSTATPNPALDLEFDLSNPAFLLGHLPPGATATQWAVNFDAPVRRHPIADITRLVLRHAYGTVTGVAADGSSITITKDYPVLPATGTEIATASSQSLTILADSVNGTLFYDVDTKTTQSVKSFTGLNIPNGEFVRIAARYQENGTLVATRVWESSSFANVWVSPEGHVLHADPATNTIVVENESGVGIPLLVNASTEFFFRQPQNALADATPIGIGTAFLANHNLVRGFKVHASVVDPLAVPLVAQSIDIETAEYSGTISLPSTSNFTYTHDYADASDNYSIALDYLSASTANGNDAMGNPILGYKWWNFAYPTLINSGTNAISEFVSATDGSVSFGTTAGDIPAVGVSYNVWEDPVNMSGWAAASSILLPVPVPFAEVSTPLSGSGNAYSFAIKAINAALYGTQPVTVDVNTTSGSTTLVYQVDRSNGIVTVSPVDITTPAGLATLMSGLANGAQVRVAGLAQSGGTLQAYVITYYTGTAPST